MGRQSERQFGKAAAKWRSHGLRMEDPSLRPEPVWDGARSAGRDPRPFRPPRSTPVPPAEIQDGDMLV